MIDSNLLMRRALRQACDDNNLVPDTINMMDTKYNLMDQIGLLLETSLVEMELQVHSNGRYSTQSRVILGSNPYMDWCNLRTSNTFCCCVMGNINLYSIQTIRTFT